MVIQIFGTICAVFGSYLLGVDQLEILGVFVLVVGIYLLIFVSLQNHADLINRAYRAAKQQKIEIKYRGFLSRPYSTTPTEQRLELVIAESPDTQDTLRLPGHPKPVTLPGLRQIRKYFD